MAPQHPVILGDEMRAAARPENATNLGDDARGVRDRLKEMPADHEIELRVWKRHRERITDLEANALTELRASRPRPFEMRFFEIDPDECRLRIFRSEPLSDLAGSASDIEHRSVPDRMSVEDRLFLRPDRLGLRGEIPHHRFIGHFLGLGTARMRMLHAAEL